MCQMSVLLSRPEEEELVAENASLLEVEDDGVKISALFEDPRIVHGVKVTRIDFLAGKVWLATN
ncbi:MAG: CooT family nickel-binding protein [Desulfobulbaceae bacterium]|nr:MAG: CooT family nickel-binding protein [Desulfobulbaceae bacterium]